MPPAYQLSAREGEVVRLLLQGNSNKLIAVALGITERTVEFHLQNVYARLGVNSRIELVLKLVNPTGALEMQQLWVSTVAGTEQNAENGNGSDPLLDRRLSLRERVALIGKELEMKNLLRSKQALAAVVAALLAGAAWVILFSTFVHMAPDDLRAWIVPAALVWALIGLAVAAVGKSAGSSLLRISLGTLIGTGVTPVTILPLMGFVVLPLAKLAEGLGLVDPAAISRDAATLVAIVLMLVIWLVVGTLFSTGLLFLSIGRPSRPLPPISTPEHRP